MLSHTTRARLEAELHLLETELIPAAHAAIEDSRTQGDSSQNPDFFLAADGEGSLYARRAAILAALSGEGAQAAFDGTVQVGVAVTLDFGAGDERFLFGSVEEMRSGFEVITPASPLGVVLADHRSGDVVRYGSSEIRIVAVEPA